MENTNHSITESSCVIRDTHASKGRTRAAAPGVTAARHLHYGRIILDAGDGPLNFATGEQETGLICLKGQATVKTSGESFELTRYDSLYIPRDAEVEVRPSSEGCDLAEISAPVDHSYPVQFVPFAEVQKDSGLHFKAGG